MLRLLLAAVLAVAGGASAAQSTFTGTFDVTIRGLRAGVLSISAVEDGGRYSAAARLQSSGLLSIIQEVGYDARSTGRITAGGYVPIRYQETTNTGERISRAEMEYVNGVPQLKTYDPPQDRSSRDIDPATQAGTLDPMTAIHAVFRDATAATACTLDVFVFDGKRRSQVVATDRTSQGSAIVCEGEYRRVAGFSRRQMERRARFPFRITYSEQPDGSYRVTRVVVETLYGRATLNRR
jgi:hypothetical protein